MAGILVGVVLLAWAALEAARSLFALRNLATPLLRQVLVPASVWLAGGLTLLALVPQTRLIEQGHSQALIWSLLLLTLVCAVSPLGYARQCWAQHSVNSGNRS